MREKNLPGAVLSVMRSFLIRYCFIDADRIQTPNTTFKPPTSGIWIRESFNEGSEEPKSNAATHEFMVVNYEIFGKASRGTAEVDDMVSRIRRVFPVLGKSSVIFRNCARQSAYLKSIDKPAGGIDNSDPTWYRRLVAITVELYDTR